MKKNNSLNWFTIIGPLLISVFLVVGAYLMRDKLEAFKSLGLFGIFAANLFSSATFFLPTPGIATVVAGGFLYPPILVALTAALGATLGDCVGYLVGTSGERVLHTKAGKRYGQIHTLFTRFGGVIIFLFAFIPNPIFDGIGFVAGALKYPLHRFFIWLFLGRLTRDVLLAYVGFSLAH
jgi:membrane protein DedA with SNARE-associated domain